MHLWKSSTLHDEDNCWFVKDQYIGIFYARPVSGYCVRGTVRSLGKRERYGFLYEILEQAVKSGEAGEGAALELFEADLKVSGSFDQAVEGVDYVFHVASPVVYK